jgi:hypothetical protein
MFDKSILDILKVLEKFENHRLENVRRKRAILIISRLYALAQKFQRNKNKKYAISHPPTHPPPSIVLFRFLLVLFFYLQKKIRNNNNNIEIKK